jgi:phospholipase A1/A2
MDVSIMCELNKSRSVLGFLLLGLLTLVTPAQAKDPISLDQAFMQCKHDYPEDYQSKKRHECFDSISTPVLDLAIKKNITIKEARQAFKNPELENLAVVDTSVVEKSALHYLERKWRLTSIGEWDLSDFVVHNPNYLAVTNVSSVNDIPTTPSRPNTIDRDLDNKDLEYQISFKTELWDNIPFIRDLPYVTSSRLWGAYTQKSYWQVFNSQQSKPFRENNFIPELVLSLGLSDENNQSVSVLPRVVNFGLIHESNGRSNPISRSWNRFYVQSGWQLTDDVALLVRPWYRIPEVDNKDDNPDIEKYLGYGDVVLHWDEILPKVSANFLLRNNLRADNKGYGRLDLQYDAFDSNHLKFYMMLSSGYGESLVDYNFSQSKIGIGILIGE